MYDLSQVKVSNSPHIRSEDSTRQIMLDVIIGLIPALALAIFVFGARALVVTAVSVIGCVFFEWLYNTLLKKPCSIGNCSAIVTGMLLAYTLPVTAPLWMVLIGDLFAIVIVKALFGGIGKNFMNPALGGRAFLMASYPVFMTTWAKVRTSLPLFGTPADVVTGATPLSFMKEGNLPDVSLADAALGMVGGCLGEVSALALLAGGVWLVYRRVISLRIPVCFIGTVAVLTLIFPKGGSGFEWMAYQLLSGGLMLGAFFMATDYVTSPTTRKGKLVFGIGLGVITCAIRFLGTMNEGVSFAILLMNLLVPYIEVLTRQDKLGIAKAKKGGAAK